MENETDLVYLHGQSCLGIVPTISPFVLKLETWLRMVDIPYKYVISSRPTSRTKQHPWVCLNGEEICDTNLIIGRLSKHFQKPVDENLSAEQKAVSLAFTRLVEEHTFQGYAWYRYVHGADDFWGCFDLKSQGLKVEQMYIFVGKLLQDSVKEKSWHHGIGRKTSVEIFELVEQDLRSLSVYLGEKTYMMGEEPTVIDCVLFGLLAQIFYLPLNFPPKKSIEQDCPNLLFLTNRMKRRFYPDWTEKCIPNHGPSLNK